MVYEDFTTFTEVEPDNRIQVAENHVDFQPYNNEDSYLYKDYLAGHFGDFEHLIDIEYVTSDNLGQGCAWILSNYIDDYKYLNDNNKEHLRLQLYTAGGGEKRLYIVSHSSGGVQATDYYVCSLATPYYLRIERSSTTLTCKIYSTSELRDIGGVPDIDTLTVTCINDTFRYLFVASTWNAGSGEDADINIDNLDIQEASISGVTRDSSGAVLGSCTVWLFKTSDKSFVAEVTSDAVTGAFTFTAVEGGATRFFIRAFKDGSPNVFGTTDDDLVGA